MDSLKVIYKYDLEVYEAPGQREIELDCISAEPLCVHEQYGNLTMWVLIEVGHGRKGHKKHTINVEVIGTGHPVIDEDIVDKKYVGTVVMRSTPYVWHVYSDSVQRS